MAKKKKVDYTKNVLHLYAEKEYDENGMWHVRAFLDNGTCVTRQVAENYERHLQTLRSRQHKSDPNESSVGLEPCVVTGDYYTVYSGCDDYLLGIEDTIPCITSNYLDVITHHSDSHYSHSRDEEDLSPQDLIGPRPDLIEE